MNPRERDHMDMQTHINAREREGERDHIGGETHTNASERERDHMGMEIIYIYTHKDYAKRDSTFRDRETAQAQCFHLHGYDNQNTKQKAKHNKMPYKVTAQGRIQRIPDQRGQQEKIKTL